MAISIYDIKAKLLDEFLKSRNLLEDTIDKHILQYPKACLVQSSVCLPVEASAELRTCLTERFEKAGWTLFGWTSQWGANEYNHSVQIKPKDS